MTGAVDPSNESESLGRQVRKSGSSFYAAMYLLGPARRQAMYAIYAFCRTVDDIADSDEPAEKKRAQLRYWRAEIARLFRGVPETAIGRALLVPVQSYALREQDFLAIIDGMDMDAARDIWAPSSAELDLYCDRVASAVGRLAVRVFGESGPAADEVAHHLGRALQLTNILRDLAEDYTRHRLYLPHDLLQAHGIDPDSAVLSHPSLPQVCMALALRAEEHYRAAHAAIKRCGRAPMRPARMMGAVYYAYLRKLRQGGWRNLAIRVRLSLAHKLWIILRYGIL
ncbi:MAG TPA: presqualene diphosphate synthase HpnD [Dongiaceae bacterium]|jgi:phytoene synthase|nr:presqualene diphosphate synthase HpnD [Dongiaceae bacterium]